MAQQKKQWGAIIVMILLFAMIAFVTNLCSPMALIIKNQGTIPEWLTQIGNYGNFVAYLVMGIPAGMLISKFGYKKTALIGLAVGILGILIQWYSGQLDAQKNLGLVFGVYLAGAFIAGFCMCILNCVVNPMLNILGGGGNTGNQLIQTGGVFNSAAAVAVYILMGALIGDVTKAKIADATPALLIALGIFVVAFIVILFTKIEEPEQAPVDTKLIGGALKYRHFTLGALAIFLYMGIEVGVPNYINFFLTADTPEMIQKKADLLTNIEGTEAPNLDEAAKSYVALYTDMDKIQNGSDVKEKEKLQKDISDIKSRLEKKELTAEKISQSPSGRGIDAATAGLIVAVYWLMMLVGRFVGASIGGKISSRAMITTVSIMTIVLVAFGMFAPQDMLVNVPGIDWAKLQLTWTKVPVGIFAFILVGLCTSVMWGGIFNMAVEGLGKYTAVASGIFMTMVFGCAVMLAIQSTVAGFAGYMQSYWVVLFCAAYILFYALVGSKPSKKAEE